MWAKTIFIIQFLNMKIKNFLKISSLLVLLFSVFTLSAQQPVKWSTSSKDLGNGLFSVELKANIASGWHIYDVTPFKMGFPTHTAVVFTPGTGAANEGGMKVNAPHTKRYFDDTFGQDMGEIEGTATFTQKVKLSAQEATVKISVSYQACQEGACQTPEDLTFDVTLKQSAAPAAKAEEPKPEEVKAEEPEAEAAEATTEAEVEATETEAEAAEAEVTVTESEEEGESIWGYIIEAVLWGFAALLTPCVFPMVPMTVSYFLKGEGGVAMGRLRASLYGLFIVLLYTLPIAAIIIITRVVGGDAVTADIFNWLATHWLPNIIFFIVFMVFAASFFGAFEITMPSWMVNKTDEKADTKGLSGIFFLALTLVLVSFSCTGPIVGSVLIKSTAGEFWTPIITMLAFSLAFALPFTLLALFPSLLKKMPKSGGWLNSVKVVIGFIEVALGLKFLSVADQTYHWGLLDREVYLAIWIVVFALMGLYLLGKIKFSHDSDMPYLGVGRLALAIVVFSFVVYLIPGMWGAPLKALSGYLPPMTSQDYVVTAGGVASQQSDELAGESRKYSDFLHLPNGLTGFFDITEAEAYAKKVNKPIFIDFTGHGCVNCREMEQRVWSDPRVMKLLREEFVIVALYVDDKTELPESDWVTTESGKVLKELGKINSNYALEKYGVNAQPYYVLRGKSGETLVEPHKYDLEVENFIKFLEAGIEAYNKQ